MRLLEVAIALTSACFVFASPLQDALTNSGMMERAAIHSDVVLPFQADHGHDAEYLEQIEKVERDLRAMAREQGLTKRALEERANSHAFVHSVKCGHSRPANDKKCQQSISAEHLPKNGLAVCSPSKGTCEVSCQKGFVPRNYMCYKSATVCHKKKCPKLPPNGLYVCSKDAHVKDSKKCQLLCRKKLVPNQQGKKCLDLQNDPYHCGKEGNRCPHSYNGHGKRVCSKGKCTGSCIKGNHLRKTSKGQFYCTRQ